jgi:hypothetical protein
MANTILPSRAVLALLDGAEIHPEHADSFGDERDALGQLGERAPVLALAWASYALEWFGCCARTGDTDRAAWEAYGAHGGTMLQWLHAQCRDRWREHAIAGGDFEHLPQLGELLSDYCDRGWDDERLAHRHSR